MNRIRRSLDRLTIESSGMTLVEVIVAIAIMGIVATAAIGLAISSTIGAVSQQRRAIAVTVANSAMETVSGLPADALVSGRTVLPVHASFTSNSGISGISKTYEKFDTNPLTMTLGPTVPIVASVAQNGTIYSVTTIIGTCFERLGTNAGQVAGGDCAKLDVLPYAPLIYSGYTPLTRVLVVVAWTAGQECATAGSCVYSVSSLIDSHSDLEWKTNG